MKTSLKVSSFFGALSLLLAPAAMAQNAPAGLGTSNCAINSVESKGGQISVGLLGREGLLVRIEAHRDVVIGVLLDRGPVASPGSPQRAIDGCGAAFCVVHTWLLVAPRGGGAMANETIRQRRSGA